MSLLGGPGESRINVLDGVTLNEIRSFSVAHLIAKNSAAVKKPKQLGSLPKSGRSMLPTSRRVVERTDAKG